MSDERCEPPEELRGVDGWHWMRHSVRSEDGVWHERPCWWDERMHHWLISPHAERATSEKMAEWGWLYLCPIPTPADLAAAKEREAALVGALKGLLLACEYTANRSGGEYSANIGPHAYAAVDALNAHAPNWRTAP